MGLRIRWVENEIFRVLHLFGIPFIIVYLWTRVKQKKMKNNENNSPTDSFWKSLYIHIK